MIDPVSQASHTLRKRGRVWQKPAVTNEIRALFVDHITYICQPARAAMYISTRHIWIGTHLGSTRPVHRQNVRRGLGTVPQVHARESVVFTVDEVEVATAAKSNY